MKGPFYGNTLAGDPLFLLTYSAESLHDLFLPVRLDAFEYIRALHVYVFHKLGDPVAEKAVFRKVLYPLGGIVLKIAQDLRPERIFRIVGGSGPQHDDLVNILLGKDIFGAGFRNAETVAVGEMTVIVIVKILVIKTVVP